MTKMRIIALSPTTYNATSLRTLQHGLGNAWLDDELRRLGEPDSDFVGRVARARDAFEAAANAAADVGISRATWLTRYIHPCIVVAGSEVTLVSRASYDSLLAQLTIAHPYSVGSDDDALRAFARRAWMATLKLSRHPSVTTVFTDTDQVGTAEMLLSAEGRRLAS